MLRILFTTIILSCSAMLMGQNVGIGTNTPDPSAKLDISATDQGLLVPRVQLDDVNTAAPITSPAEGLIIYNETGTAPTGFYFWDGTAWGSIGGDGLPHDNTGVADGNILSWNAATSQYEPVGASNGLSQRVGEFFFAKSGSTVQGLLPVTPGTVANGAVDYPAWAAMYPEYVSGNDIVFPADVAGMFLRNTGGQATTEGAIQADATSRPNSSFVTNSAGAHSHSHNDYHISRMDIVGGFDSDAAVVIPYGGGGGATSPRMKVNEAGGEGLTLSGFLFNTTTASAGNHTHTITSGGDAETRPANRAFQLYTIVDTYDATGLVGPAGAVGPQGPQGLAGVDGIDGAVGPQGPIGLTGADGAVGPQGLAGNDGIDGAVGPQGPIGATGADGPQGPVGPAGADGIDGAVGPQGPIGATGPAGPAGNDGADGAQGPIGLTGPQGPAGADGATGPAGADGADGQGGVTTAGTNITITGAGSTGDPYVVSSTDNVDDADSDPLNELELPQSPNAGEMNYWDGTNWVTVSAGTHGQTLSFCGGVPIWGPCPETCTDGIQNQDETGVDCGGTSCSACITGCMDATAHNYNATAQLDDGSCETCSDGIQNGDEAAIDCGGSNPACTPCITGCMDATAHNYDATAQLDDGSCETCTDGILNGDETGVDCGGTSCTPCASASVRVLPDVVGNFHSQTLLQSLYDAQPGVDAPDTVPNEVSAYVASLGTGGYKLYLGHNIWWYTSAVSPTSSADWVMFSGGGKTPFSAAVATGGVITFK